MKKRIELTPEEQITLRTLIRGQIRRNKKYEEKNLSPCMETEELKTLYKKIAGFEWQKD